MDRELFHVKADVYAAGKTFTVTHPASLDHPSDHAVMFVLPRLLQRAAALESVDECLVFWPEGSDIPENIRNRHAVVPCAEPRLEYCRFFRDNQIDSLPPAEGFREENGALICFGAEIGRDTVLMPGCYIGGGVTIGEDCYVGAGTKLVGTVHIGDHVVIRENTVIGADGLTAYRYPDGTPATMPQFGGVWIGDGVQIGANTVIARGTIDDTVLEKNCKVSNNCSISHNVFLGEGTLVVGESMLFGGARTGKRVFISGNAVIRNKAVIGDDALIGMGAVVVKDVEAGATVIGNPARKK